MATVPRRIPLNDSTLDAANPAPEGASESRSAETGETAIITGDELRHEHPTPEEVAAEAYAIYIANGGQHGRDRDDWLEAEMRLRGRRTRSTREPADPRSL